MSVVGQITFRPELSGCVGIEQEFFLFEQQLFSAGGARLWGDTLLDRVSLPTPRSPEFLERIQDGRWTYELSACQVEVRTAPHRMVADACEELEDTTATGSQVAASLGCSLVACEVVPDSIPLDVYPSERYLALAQKLPKRVLRAACQVAGIHVHYGCRDMAHALAVYHELIQYTDVFLRMGDFSAGKRMNRYLRVAPDCTPPTYASVAAFEAVHTGSLRDCYHLIRITPYGTVEVRCFGSTPDMTHIRSFVHLVQSVGQSVR